MDFRDELHRIDCPVLLMVGQEDPITPPEFSDEIAKRLDDSQLTYRRYQDCGHGVVADKPGEALSAMRDFIARIDGKTNP